MNDDLKDGSKATDFRTYYVRRGVRHRGEDARPAILAEWISKTPEQRGEILVYMRHVDRCELAFLEAERKFEKEKWPGRSVQQHEIPELIAATEVNGRAAWKCIVALKELGLCYERQRNETITHADDLQRILLGIQLFESKCKWHLSTQKGARARSAGSVLSENEMKPRKILVDPIALNAKHKAKPMTQLHEDGITIFEGDWRAVSEMPNGEGHAKLGIFVRLDEAGKIIDRIVKKTDYLYDFQWNNMLTWQDDPSDGENRILREFYMQDKCASANKDVFVGARAWHQDFKKRKTTLYIEYCGYGDMVDGLTSLYDAQQKAIPEPVLFYIFRQLAYACVIMYTGGDLDTSEDWKEIVHRDIKTENIFLDAPDPSIFRGYCRPKIADFGHAIETAPSDVLNPHSFNNKAGTPNFRAPEQLSYVDVDTDEPMDDWQLLSHTNVYAIGAVMMDLVWNRDLEADPGMYEPDFTNPFSSWQHSEWTKANYSKELLDLIDECVKWEPSERISAGRLLSTISTWIHSREEQPFRYLRNERNAKEGQEEGDEFTMLKKQDVYKLGMVYDETAQMAALNI